MPDAFSIPFKQAAGNGHYESKQLPNDRELFLTALDLPSVVGDISGTGQASVNNQIVVYDGTSGISVKPATETGLATLTGGVLSVTPPPATALVGTTAAQTLTNKTIDGANNTLNVRLNTTDVSGNLPVNKLNGGTGAHANSYWRGDGTWTTPAGAGDVTGAASSADNDITVFSGASGKLLKTTGRQLSTLGDVSGPATVVSGNIPSFNGTTGKLLADSGRPVSDVAVGPASAVDGEVVLFNGTTGKVIKRSTGTGIAVLAAGVQSAITTIPESYFPPGTPVQVGYAEYTTWANLTGRIPVDNTIPLVSEGTEIINLSFTPKFANSKLVLNFKGQAWTDWDDYLIGTMFVGSTCIDATLTYNYRAAANVVNYAPIVLAGQFTLVSGAAVALTVRVGTSQASQYLRMNGDGTSRYFGGASRCVLNVQEVRQ